MLWAAAGDTILRAEMPPVFSRDVLVISFQDKPGPRNYFSHREQRRLLLLVMCLGLVVIFMIEARDPANWAWFVVLTKDAEKADGAAPARPPRSKRPAKEGPAGRYYPGVKPTHLDSIRDNTRFRHEEKDAWFHLFAILEGNDEAALEKASVGRVSRLQLFEQSDEYRGELVSLRGRICRAHRVKAPENQYGISGYYQTWLQPLDSPDRPIVVYCLYLPEGFATGMKLDEEVRLTGFYFKRWVYQGQDQIEIAPTVLARTVRRDKRPFVEQEEKPTDTAEKPGPPPGFSGPRELLELVGIDQSHLAKLVDGRPWHEDENETLHKLMFRLPGIPLTEVERWAHAKLDLDAFGKGPDARRGKLQGEFFRLRGRTSSVEVIRPPAEVAARFEMKQYYRVEFRSDEADRPMVVFARTVPKAWRNGGPIDQRAGALGMFLKLAVDQDQRPVPVFAAARIAVYPPNLLGELGMDVGLLNDLRDKRPIDSRQRECFYQMLAAVGRARPGQLRHAAYRRLKQTGRDCFSVVPLFNQPEAQRGRLVVLSGTARRVVRVRVDDADIRRRFAIDHYYELYLFTDDSQQNPLVFCVRELPPGMPTGDDPQFAEHVEVAGFFLKSWAYRPVLSDDGLGSTRQLAPLLIGRAPRWYPPREPADYWPAGAIAGGLFLLVLLGIWIAVWRFNRSDERFFSETIRRTRSGDDGVRLDELDLAADAKPDFESLDPAADKKPDFGSLDQSNPADSRP